MPHPTLKLVLTTDASDYERIGVGCPQITPSTVSNVTDTGAQSALWGLQSFYKCGFKDSDLLPVKRTMRAANMEEIHIYINNNMQDLKIGMYINVLYIQMRTQYFL